MRIDQLKKPARKKYDAALSAHQFKLAIAKLGVLLPLFVIVALAFYRYRSSPYRPLLMASLLACSWWLAMVTHDHFPSELFKYLAIGTGIAMVVFALTRLISNMAAPQLDLVLQRYREAYQRHRCPICDDPILRGPFKNAVWTRKGPILPTGVVGGADRPYTCPSCGTGLFEKCGACDTVRHALLPFCDGCGDKHTVITA